ncbi:myrosinase 1-like [Epargyreus clarus]|uniref:myrosinase 1-like n=1 Tax=Epargyreus clarus TaxID=520877 RepID=UPI003C2C2F45
MSQTATFVFCAILATAYSADRKFPPGFIFGAGTSSYQIEGGWNVTDKSESIWDVFAHTPGKVRNDDNGDIACDSYNKWKDDVQMAADLGLHFYRFSLSWPRLLPTGFPNEISEDGKNYYNNLIDGLLEKGIQPVITIYHWELPQRLQNLGGWTNPSITDWFADYARVVYTLYADRVKTWITINEPIIMCDLSYNTGVTAPGIKDPLASYMCGKHVMIAHAKAWRIYDKEFKPKHKGRVSVTNQLIWFEAKTPEEEELAKLTRDLSVGLHSHPIYSKEGGWPPVIEEYIAKKSKEEGYARSRLPEFTPEEIELVKGTYDFYALNYYTGGTIRKARDGETIDPWPLSGLPELEAVIEKRPEWKKSEVYWFSVYPEGLRKQLVWLKENYGDLEFLIVENGYPSIGLNLQDLNRISCIEGHLEQILLAIKEDGINITGYTVWSLMDNFEWNEGYSIKFGLYEVDFADPARTRTPRASAHYYASVIKSHTLDVNIVENKHITDEL